MGTGHGERIAQCKNVKLTTTKTLPFQVDGGRASHSDTLTCLLNIGWEEGEGMGGGRGGGFTAPHTHLLIRIGVLVRRWLLIYIKICFLGEKRCVRIGVCKKCMSKGGA